MARGQCLTGPANVLLKMPTRVTAPGPAECHRASIGRANLHSIDLHNSSLLYILLSNYIAGKGTGYKCTKKRYVMRHGIELPRGFPPKLCTISTMPPNDIDSLSCHTALEVFYGYPFSGHKVVRYRVSTLLLSYPLSGHKVVRYRVSTLLLSFSFVRKSCWVRTIVHPRDVRQKPFEGVKLKLK